MEIWVGIDISAETFDAAWVDETGRHHLKIDNKLEQFPKLLAAAPNATGFVMEATGSYYLNLALSLSEEGRYVSVVNPLRIKSHCKADMARSKSDKSDAYAIARFGSEKKPAPWSPVTKDRAAMQQLRALADKINMQITQLSNQRHAFSQSRLVCEEATHLIDSMIKVQRRVVEVTMEELEEVAKRAFPRELELATSIRGIGEETATRILTVVGDFKRFSTGRQLVSFLRISPTLKQSGTSVHSRGHISRLGSAQVRKALYFCAITATRFNPQCKSMWIRMKEQKKPTKVILMAIANKLIRQIHALIRTNKPYDPNFNNFSLAK
ncbi:MAG: IS110 family transposase [Fibrobacteres bacterium]|nr:IS110 family transposase [Fibrobacterota bacterium]